MTGKEFVKENNDAVDGPDIRVAAEIDLPPEIRDVLRRMFASFEKLAVEAEFGGGFGGSRVFRVRPVESEGHIHLPAVVKIAPIGVIRQEWAAYQNWVARTLPKVAPLEDPPLLPVNGAWGGLRYALAGAGAFEIQSLRDYYQTATLTDLHWILEERLFKIMQSWWLHNRADQTFQMQTDYDSLLPPNLLIKPVASPTSRASVVIDANNFDALGVEAGDQIEVRGFIIDKVEPEEQEVTLNLPPGPSDQRSDSYRVRLVEVTDFEPYQPGNIIDSIRGNVTATRQDILTGLVNEAIGGAIDLTAESLHWPDDSPLPSALPNPLLRCQHILRAFQTVKISKIHGDLNMANILVDPATRDVELIDFATVRQGHALHDLLRLETEVVIMLMPAAFAEAGLSAEAIGPLYEQLHRVTLTPERNITPNLVAASLKKPFEVLRVIRKMARACLFNLNDWGEYYQGLTLYLLGALKFGSLNRSPLAPLPKQLAFLGAAMAQYLLETPLLPEDPPGKLKRPKKPISPDKASSEIEPPFGAMRPNSTMYIERTADDYCFSQISQSYAATLFIKASRQMGKTSLLHRTLYRVNQERQKPSAFVDLQEFPKQYFDDEENFLIQFCLSVGDDLGLPPAVDQYWQGAQTGSIKCRAYMSDYIIPQVNEPFILALDELDRVLVSPFRDNFFGMLRAWHNYRARDENFAKLSLLLSSSTEPYLFIDNPNQSPFNVAEVITLQDFTGAEVAELNRRHHSPLNQEQVEVLMDLVGGHPFLTRLALYQLATGKIDWETLLSRAIEDNGPFGENLRYYLARINRKPELGQALRDICRHRQFADNQIFQRLKGAGLVKRVGGQVVFRNQLYARYFEEHFNA